MAFLFPGGEGHVLYEAVKAERGVHGTPRLPDTPQNAAAAISLRAKITMHAQVSQMGASRHGDSGVEIGW